MSSNRVTHFHVELIGECDDDQHAVTMEEIVAALHRQFPMLENLRQGRVHSAVNGAECSKCTRTVIK